MRPHPACQPGTRSLNRVPAGHAAPLTRAHRAPKKGDKCVLNSTGRAYLHRGTCGVSGPCRVGRLRVRMQMYRIFGYTAKHWS